jgi:hypothetical protein
MAREMRSASVKPNDELAMLIGRPLAVCRHEWQCYQQASGLNRQLSLKRAFTLQVKCSTPW